jgi:outer membrane protein
LLASAAAVAEEHDPSGEPNPGEEQKSYSWGLGAGAISQQLSYTGIDRDNIAVPLIFFENRWVQLFGPWLDLKLPTLKWEDEQELSFGARVQLFGVNGYESDDAPILDGMAERKSGLFAGAVAKWSNPFVNVQAEWLFDASGESKGQRATFGLERSFFVGKHFMFTPAVNAIWMDKKYTDYYYGVRSSEARAGRPAYVGESTLNAEISLRTDYLLDQHQSLFLSLGYMALGSEIKDSPLTDRPSETNLFMGYLYRF